MNTGLGEAALRALYAVAAVLVVALSFVTLFEERRVLTSTIYLRTTYGSLYDMADRDAGGPAVFGLVLLYLFAVLGLIAAAFAPRFAVYYAALTVLCAVGAIMLIAKPGTGSPAPDLATGGLVMLVVVVVLGVVALFDAISRMIRASRG